MGLFKDGKDKEKDGKDGLKDGKDGLKDGKDGKDGKDSFESCPMPEPTLLRKGSIVKSMLSDLPPEEEFNNDETNEYRLTRGNQ
jgi:hypothetical protein